MRKLKSINKKTNEEYDKQAAKVELLTMIINDNNVSLQKRLEKLAELKEIVPGYNAQLTEEGKLINNNTTAIKDYLKAFEQKIRLQAAEEELTQLIKDKIVAENALKEAEKKRQEVQNRSGSKVRGRGLAAERRTKADLEEAKKNLDQLENAILDVNKLRVSLIAEETVVPNAGGGGGGDDPLEDEDRIKKDMERLEAEHLSKMLALKERYLSDSSMSEDEYNQEIERLALELLLSKMDISGLELNDQQKLLDAIFNMKIKARDKILSMERKKSEQERKNM